ncbi:hypothetical protein ACWOA6_06380 [Globicatella sulfidifaciens]|uniref:Uncharacterized protein n=1 Tax=Globicatella sulfidifaciens DSM 15739 TaxID=1121925 RepID=A0A1T4MUS6_9LACT|nr:hypothetical protein [Globicatella sulfidifaciens]SJZ70742.1 hypothetical protein SAMN02746011_01554 [Globicatella sulfidifaciens DSM 15739]
MKTNRVVKVVDFFYTLVKSSLIFWRAMLKNGIIFGLVEAMIEMLNYIDQKGLGKNILKLEKTTDNKVSYVLSLLFMFFTMATFIGVSTIAVEYQQLIGMAILICSAEALIVLLVSLHYTIVKDRISLKRLYNAIKNIIKDWSLTLLFIGCIFFGLIIVYFSPILAFFVYPGLMGNVICLYLIKIYSKKEVSL